jgi:ribosomal protein S6
MPHYSIMCITTRSAPASHLVSLFSRIASTLSSSSALLTRVDNLGVRPLAHRMKAHQKYNFHGRYVRMECIASPAVLAEVERKLKVDEEVVRFMTLKERRIGGAAGATRVGMQEEEEEEYKDEAEAEDAEDETEERQTAAEITAQPAFVDPAILTSLQSTSSIDFYTARLLLEEGLLSEEEIMALDRHKPDQEWEQRTAEAREKRRKADEEAERKRKEAEAARDTALQQQVEEQYAQMKLYLDRRREEVADAKQARLQWREREDERAVERTRAVDDRLIDKWVRKEVEEARRRASRAGKAIGEEQEAKMREEMRKRLWAEHKKKKKLKAVPVQ